MLEDCIYSKEVQYFRKGKWRNCQLQIENMKRCQDTLAAVIHGISDKAWSLKFPINGYECNNYCISLFGKNFIHRIKFESFEMVQTLTEVLIKYMKDLSFKFQLVECSSNPDVLIINKWYTFHVQTNRICFTADGGNRLITKWDRSDIGQCGIENNILNIEIHSKNGKIVYSFFKEERFTLEKTYKAIQNLKFELPLPKPDKFTLTPHRSGSIEVRRCGTWGNTKERIARERNSCSFRNSDLYSNEDSSAPSTPCSPISGSIINDHSKDFNQLQESDELIFPFDSLETQSMTSNSCYKRSECQDSGIHTLSNVSSPTRFVELERCPYESERKSHGKKSPECMSSLFPGHTPTAILTYNVYEGSRNSSVYQTINSLAHSRKASSEANFLDSHKEATDKVPTSYSADVTRNMVVASDAGSQCSNQIILLSSSNISTRTPAGLKTKDRLNFNGDYLEREQYRLSVRRTSYSDCNHNYYNLQSSPVDFKRTSFAKDNSNRVSSSLSLKNPYYNFNPEEEAPDQIEFPQDMDHALNYSEIQFDDNSTINVPKKVSAPGNYTEIDHLRTEALREVDDNISNNLSNRGPTGLKKKKSSIFKYLKK